MIIKESKLIDEKYVDGYYLTIDDLSELVRDFQADCHDGFVSNDHSYIELWLTKHDRIIKTDKKSDDVCVMSTYGHWCVDCKTKEGCNIYNVREITP